MDSERLGTELVQHAGSLRRLARDLLHDAHLAEDAVQDAMQVAITRPPRSGEALSAWLRTVVRSCALDLGRGERRRREREWAASSASSSIAPDASEQAELIRHVLAAVQALDEPYRTTVWQRYFGDLSPRQIAARESVPVKTVKTRLWRALAELRKRLDRRCGDREAWFSVLGPLFVAPSPKIAGVLLMSSKAKLMFAFALTIVIAISWTTWSADPAAPPGVPAAQSSTSADTAAETLAPSDERAPARMLAESSAQTIALDALPSITMPTAIASVPLAGVVLDVDARPVSRLQLVCNRAPFDPPVVTAADGRFSATRVPGMATLGVLDEGFVAVLEPTLYDNEAVHLDLTIIVSPSASLAGKVVDEAGRPIERAEVSASLGIDVRTRIPRVLDRCVTASFAATTASDGTFALGKVPAMGASRVSFTARGFRPLELPVSEARYLTRFVLERAIVGDTLEGLVVDEHDRPIPQAVVHLPSWSVVTEPDGTFQIELWKAHDLPEGVIPDLVAVASGRLPGKLTASSPDWRSRSAWPRELRLRLGGVTERITGHVRRSDGEPVLDVQIAFLQPEPEQIMPTVFDTPSWGNAAVDVLIADDPAAEAGAFATALVAPGSYRLRVFDPELLEVMVTDPIRTGLPPVQLRMPDRGLWPALRGTVVDRRGTPVAGADWILEREDPTSPDVGVINGAWHQATDEGRIEQPPVSRAVPTLCVKAAGMVNWVRFQIAELAGVDFQVVVPVGCQARVEVGAVWGSIDQVGFVDLAGKRSSVVLTHGNVAWGSTEIGIVEGRSQTFVALDDCVEMLLFRGGVQVGKVPVDLRPGVMNVLMP